jgi:hypothetical protein
MPPAAAGREAMHDAPLTVPYSFTWAIASAEDGDSNGRPVTERDAQFVRLG